MNETDAKQLWNRIISVLQKTDLEIETYVLTNSKTVMYKVSLLNNDLQISETGKSGSCKLNGPRVIDVNEFVKTSYYFEQWKSKQIQRQYIVHTLGFSNVSYIFGLIHYFETKNI